MSNSQITLLCSNFVLSRRRDVLDVEPRLYRPHGEPQQVEEAHGEQGHYPNHAHAHQGQDNVAHEESITVYRDRRQDVVQEMEGK